MKSFAVVSFWLFSLLVHPLRSLALQPITRPRFFANLAATATLPLGFPTLPRFDSGQCLPLVFLPKAGCLAIFVELTKNYGYFAVVDTGSPFLTAPPTAEDYTITLKSNGYSSEQYGEAVGEVMWRKSPHVVMYDLTGRQVKYAFTEVGIPAQNVLDDTGGVFLGLLALDAERPTVLQQWGISSFCLDYVERTLTLFRNDPPATLNDESSEIHQLFDFSPFGSNVHHFGVVCDHWKLDTDQDIPTISSLQRPVIIVLDSGLTGCIFSESLREELHVCGAELGKVTGATLSFGKTALTSNPTYWSLSSFALPWFDLDPHHHPHVIAAGGTFLCDTKITVYNNDKIQVISVQ